MKQFMLAAILITSSLSTYVFANQSGPFMVWGRAQCTGDCRIAVEEAALDAQEKADEICTPGVGVRISEFQSKMVGYGRLSAGALFICQ